MRIDLTPIAQLLISIVAALIGRHLIPWLKEKAGQERTARLMRYAGIAVRAAEQIYKENGSGSEKLNYVLQYLNKRGFNLSAEELRAAVESAVYEMKSAVDAGQAA